MQEAGGERGGGDGGRGGDEGERGGEDFCFELLLRRLRLTLRLPSCCSYSSDEVSEGEGLEEPSC